METPKLGLWDTPLLSILMENGAKHPRVLIVLFLPVWLGAKGSLPGLSAPAQRRGGQGCSWSSSGAHAPGADISGDFGRSGWVSLQERGLLSVVFGAADVLTPALRNQSISQPFLSANSWGRGRVAQPGAGEPPALPASLTAGVSLLLFLSPEPRLGADPYLTLPFSPSWLGGEAPQAPRLRRPHFVFYLQGEEDDGHCATPKAGCHPMSIPCSVSPTSGPRGHRGHCVLHLRASPRPPVDLLEEGAGDAWSTQEVGPADQEASEMLLPSGTTRDKGSGEFSPLAAGCWGKKYTSGSFLAEHGGVSR